MKKGSRRGLYYCKEVYILYLHGFQDPPVFLISPCFRKTIASFVSRSPPHLLPGIPKFHSSVISWVWRWGNCKPAVPPTPTLVPQAAFPNYLLKGNIKQKWSIDMPVLESITNCYKTSQSLSVLICFRILVVLQGHFEIREKVKEHLNEYQLICSKHLIKTRNDYGDRKIKTSYSLMNIIYENGYLNRKETYFGHLFN